jgi:YidC/Oxa1 family membrane protein insertase
MQPKNSLQNILLFFLLSALVIFGSWRLQTWLFPPQPNLAEAKLIMTRAAGTGGVAATPAIPTLGGAAQLAVNAALAEYLAEHNYKLPRLAKQEPAKKEDQQQAKAQPPAPKPAAPPRQAFPRKIVQIGGDSYKLDVLLTSLGAGVQRLVLTQFLAADRMGRPVGGDVKLELIPSEFNIAEPSFLLYHYANPEDEHPVDTLGKIEWELESQKKVPENGDHEEVIFATDVPDQDIRIRKIFTLWPDEYHIGLRLEFSRKSGKPEPLKFRYQLTSGHGLPIEGEWYTNVYRNAVAGLAGPGKNFKRELQDSRSIGIKEGGDSFPKGEKNFIQYAGVMVQYFAALLVPTDRIVLDDASEPRTKEDFLERARPTVESSPDPKKPYLDDITVRVIAQAFDVKEPVVQKYLLYCGPVKPRLLGDVASGAQGVPPEVVDRYINKLHLNTLTDTGNFMWWTDILVFFTNLMHGILGWAHSVIPNYGICIMVLTLLVRVLMHPVSRKQTRMSLRMQELMPELKKIQEKHKGDRAEAGRAQMELYRKHGVHPLGSCWIVLLQMPIFLGLYYCLQESIHFRLASFLWIKNLAAPDMLIWWGERIPYISDPANQGGFLYLGPYFNLLPVLAVSLMVVQQKFLMPPPADEQAAMQQKMMKYMMIVMGVMFYKVAAGLCLYFIVSTLWGLAERKMLPKAKPAGTQAALGKPGAPGGRTKAIADRAKPRAAKAAPTNGFFFRKVQEVWSELLKQAKKK